MSGIGFGLGLRFAALTSTPQPEAKSVTHAVRIKCHLCGEEAPYARPTSFFNPPATGAA